jgi:N-acetylated-alpha-linked acidic dipeptidase
MFATLTAASPVAAQLPPPGFATARADTQRALERTFLSGFSADSARAAVRMLSTGPVLSGTPAAHEQAELLAERLRRLGFHVRLERFEPWLPHPVDIAAGLVAPDTLTFSMREPSAGSGAPDTAAALWNWLAYAANGVAEAPVVYANFGLPSDYAALEAAGIDVRGAIVLARLGRAYRGVKIFEAEARGATGVILFADPAADGFVAGDTFPDGPYRPSWSVQRGTVAAMWRLTGDPLTPGSPAFIRARRIDPANATNLPGIPAVTIGYGDASAILARLEGPRLDGFDGGLDVAYRTGPGPARMHIRNQQTYARRPILHVIATLPGEEDRPVILGNHFDAWVSGGADPHVGTAAVLEIARGLGRLRRQGWQPRRSIVLAFWDAEEFGVVGSTEWVEAHIRSLSTKATAYFNIDTFTAGTLDVTGSPALLDLVRSAAEAVDDPVTGRTVAQEWVDRADGAPKIGDIGAGSDWTAFLHHAGVPSLQWTMNGRGTYAVYHSSLDTSEYVERFVDPDLQHTPVLASVMGLALLRLADADAAPFRYSYHAARIRRHLELREREAAEAGLGLETATLRVALERFGTAALAVEAAADAALGNADAGVWQRIDAVLPRIEGAFLDQAGLPGRPWYRHLLNAPGEDTGYDALPLPAVAEAIRRGDAEAAQRAVGDVVAALGRATVMLETLIRPAATR